MAEGEEVIQYGSPEVRMVVRPTGETAPIVIVYGMNALGGVDPLDLSVFNNILSRLPNLIDGKMPVLATDVASVANSIDVGQITMNGSSIHFSAVSKIYKRLIITAGPSNQGDIYLGGAGVTALSGLYVSEIAPTALDKVDISALYAIGINADKLTWMGLY